MSQMCEKAVSAGLPKLLAASRWSDFSCPLHDHHCHPRKSSSSQLPERGLQALGTKPPLSLSVWIAVGQQLQECHISKILLVR